jgi:hypothetical protein
MPYTQYSQAWSLLWHWRAPVTPPVVNQDYPSHRLDPKYGRRSQ